MGISTTFPSTGFFLFFEAGVPTPITDPSIPSRGTFEAEISQLRQAKTKGAHGQAHDLGNPRSEQQLAPEF